MVLYLVAMRNAMCFGVYSVEFDPVQKRCRLLTGKRHTLQVTAAGQPGYSTARTVDDCILPSLRVINLVAVLVSLPVSI